MIGLDPSSWLWQNGANWFEQPPLLSVTGLLVAVLAGWLVVRARRPKMLTQDKAAKPKPVWKDILRRRFDALTSTLNYLSTRRGWRYASPWVMLLGEAGGGKSSLAASLSDGRRESALLRERLLPTDGADWYFCSGGIVIDPHSGLTGAEPESKQASLWQKLLNAIDERRPERAIDATVLVVSADTLLKADADSLTHLAEACFKQLWQVQKTFEFVLPLYVVVSRCDSVPGYAGFWRNQTEKARRSLWGWSNPSLTDHEAPNDIAKIVFDEIGNALRQLQIDVAARQDNIESADNFFLFPQNFAQLQSGLAILLETVLKPSVHHASFYFRGVYFSGSMMADGSRDRGACEQVDFADPLFQDKIFKEPCLARPLRQSIWSRNRLLRNMQIGLLAVFVFFSLGLGWNSVQLKQQVNDFEKAESLVEQASHRRDMDGQCIASSSVYRLLDRIGQIRANMTYPFLPASWVDHRVADQAGEWLANQSFQDIVMPSLACHMEKEARALIATEPFVDDASLLTTQAVDQARSRLGDYVNRVIRFERNLAAFHLLAQDVTHVSVADQARSFDGLVSSVYQQPLPKSLRGASDTYISMIANLNYDHDPVLPENFRVVIAGNIRTASQELQRELFGRMGLGGKLLNELDRASINAADGVAGLQDWIHWLRANWLNNDAQSDLCAEISKGMDGAIAVLQHEFNYPDEIADAPLRFKPAQCREPALKQLLAQSVAPYGPLVRSIDKRYELSPVLAAESIGLSAVEKLPFMNVKPGRGFTCQVALNGWSEPQLKQIGGYLRDYDLFKLAAKFDEGNAPLFDRLARRHLQAVIQDQLVDAQRTTLSPKLAADAEARASEQSAEFANRKDELIKAGEGLIKLGDAAGAAQLTRCLRDYAGDALNRIDALADDSLLYQPKQAVLDEGEGAVSLYSLGDANATRDYLLHQRDRIAVLANYAEPYVSYLDASPAVGLPAGPIPGAGQAVSSPTRWRATLSELKKYQAAKDTGASLGALESYFLDTLSRLKYDNCSGLLSKAGQQVAGTDLFSARRHTLHDQSTLRCTDWGEADSYERYMRLANRFNRELAGRYPFADASARDLDTAAARAFFRDYAAERKNLRQSMVGLKQKRWQEIGRFLDQLDAAATVLEPSLAAADAVRPLRLDLTFRAMPKLEKGADQLIDWLMTSAAQQVVYPGEDHKLDWNWGDDITLDLTWASQSIWRPEASPASKLMTVDGATASFASQGPWSLLRWIDAHRPVSASPVDAHDPSRRLLEFNVPTLDKGGRRADARLYLMVKLAAIDGNGQAGASLILPKTWPRLAPLHW